MTKDELLIAQLESGLDNADTDADGVRELGGVVLTMQLAAARIKELIKERDSIRTSREHFKYSAERQKLRCHKLRRRQRALVSALEKTKRTTSVVDAASVANIALDGWNDDELVYESRDDLNQITGVKS